MKLMNRLPRLLYTEIKNIKGGATRFLEAGDIIKSEA